MRKRSRDAIDHFFSSELLRTVLLRGPGSDKHLFAVQAAGRTETSVHQLVAFITALLGLLCIIAFLYLIDHAAKMLRPVSFEKRVGEDGLAVIQSMDPEQFAEIQSITSLQQSLERAERTILHGKSAIVIAVNVKTLVFIQPFRSRSLPQS